MNKELQYSADDHTDVSQPASSERENYNTPQLTIHGKLERLTLAEGYNAGGDNVGDI